MPHRHEHLRHHGMHEIEHHIDDRMHSHPPVKVHLSHHQVLKIRQGKTIQIPHEHIGHHQGRTFRHLHPSNLEKLKKAHHGKKGVRLHLTTHELHGTGFLDVLKKIASPVLSGIQGVASELFPQYKGTINKVREGIRGATGYGLKVRKQDHHGHAMHSSHSGFMHGDAIHHSHHPHHRHHSMHGSGGLNEGPQHFPMGESDHYGFGVKPKKKHTKKNHNHSVGHGILPSGYGY